MRNVLTITVAAVLIVAWAGPGYAGAPVETIPPSVSAGGPYEILTGEALVLNGSAYDASGIFSEWWDIDFDGNHDDAEGATPTIPWANLGLRTALHVPYSISFEAYDVPGNSTSATTTYTVIPEPATLGLLALGGLAVQLKRRRAHSVSCNVLKHAWKPNKN